MLLLPLLAIFPPPDAWQFYALTAFNGFLVSYADAKFFDATARYGAAPVLRLKPLVLVLVFLLWLPLDWAHTSGLFEKPVLAVAIIGALLLMSISLFFMTRAPITREVLKFCLPFLLAYSLVENANKLTTNYTSGLGGALSYAIFVSLFVFLFMLPRMAASKIDTRGLFAARVVLPGFAIGLTSIAFNIAKNLAMSETPNPAYVTALIFCSGFWATLWDHYKGKSEQHNILAASGFIVGAIALMLLATL